MSNDATHWERLQTLFHLAAETPEQDRERVLAEACDDAALRRRAMALLRASTLDAPHVDAALPVALSGAIGPYSLVRHIGTGGIGTVYLAERVTGGAVQRSALKVLAPHAAGPSFVERFLREEKILGLLEHPNITRMLDAGLTDNGQPYLVMEYIDGVHLDVYCDRHKLGVEDRLPIFLSITRAVAYAHRNLVVHLDLKPSNILVTTDGIVKLVDFGTSKLLRIDGAFTATLMATPAYASPEQLRNEQVTTSCDVYSLGAILFELLAGRRPDQDASVALRLEHAMAERKPEPLATAVTPESAANRGLTQNRLRSLLTGDLATIAAKCLSPRPAQRYASVDALSEDIERYLAGRPILGRPQTSFYRFTRFLQRNRIAASITVVCALLLMTSFGYAIWKQRQAAQEGQRALRMQTFLYRLFKLANPQHTGKPAATVPEFLDLGLKALPFYIRDPRDLREAKLSLSESMYESGDLPSARKALNEVADDAKAAADFPVEAEAEAFNGNIAYQLGDSAVGEALTAHSLQLSRGHTLPPAVRAWSELYYASNRENSGAHDDRNVALLRDAVRICIDNHLSERETADAYTLLAQDLELRGLLDEAEPIFHSALAVYQKDPMARCDESGIYGELAFIRGMRGDQEGSLPLYRRSYEGLVACEGADSYDARQEQVYWAGALVQLGRAPEALTMLEPALPTWRKLNSNTPELAEILYFLSQAYIATGQYGRAADLAKEQIELQTGKIAPTDRRFGAGQLVWTQALVGEHKDAEALPHAEIAERLLGAGAKSAGAKKLAAEATALHLKLQAETHPNER
jgi:eukaryotic-like serine/threonine-protein kinase